MPDLRVKYQQTTTGLRATLTAGDGTERGQIALDAPVALQSIAIPKPWGQEIWFSGSEARGESSVTQGTTTLALSDYLNLDPARLANNTQPLLLKILDPAPTATTGNLYFETHDSKQEVYVVTHVDTSAWPNATGAIRLGMNQRLRKTYSTDADFRAAYLAAVKSYEQIRRRLDSAQQDPHQTDELAQKEEQDLRAAMEDFTATVPLRVGDVVQVGTGVPHSLQHGVRVFEFQTPTYERNIISFNQKVLTQEHWDSSYAISTMSLDGPQPPDITLLHEDNGVRVERIVNFAEFSVQRLTIEAGETYTPKAHSGYAMLALIAGAAQLHTSAGGLTLTQQTAAAFVPASAINLEIAANQQPTTILLATPNLTATGTMTQTAHT